MSTQHEIHDIDCLQRCGINAADINKLKLAGINTVRGLKMSTRKKLADIKGISEGKVSTRHLSAFITTRLNTLVSLIAIFKIDKLKEAAAKLDVNEFFTGLEVSEKRQGRWLENHH